jgi:hypothetical protein
VRSTLTPVNGISARSNGENDRMLVKRFVLAMTPARVPVIRPRGWARIRTAGCAMAVSMRSV